MLDKVGKEDFKNLIGTKVVVTVADGPDLMLTLSQLVDQPRHTCDLPDGCRTEPFSLILKGPADHQVPDGTYALTFEQIGLLENTYLDNKSEDLHVSATNPEVPDHVFYEIIFS